jgi:ketosteroid isomerase-like protein
MRMTRLLGFGVAAVLGVAVAAAAAAQQRPVQSDQEILVDLEQRWNAAFYRRDAAFIATILADDFVATYDDGSRGDKAKELALASTFAQQVESAVPGEFTVKEYGETAVVRFTLRLSGLRQGQRVETVLRYTDVWVLRDGSWRCVSSQSTRVEPSPGR